MVESNELLKKLAEIVHHLKNKQNIFNERGEERSSEFRDLEKRINPDKWIYNCKTKGISPNNFSNYQNPMELFKDLRDGKRSY